MVRYLEPEGLCFGGRYHSRPNMIRSFLRSLFAPAPVVAVEPDSAYVIWEETPVPTVEDVIRSMRRDGYSYRAIQAETGCTYYKVRKVCLSA